MVTIKDISRACNVSASTVSKVLNGYSEISPETKALVQTTAKKLGYRPNSAARLLKTNRSHNIGVLFMDDTHSGLTHEYFASILNSFKDEAERLGYDITFISSGIGNTGMSYLEHCEYRHCDGVMVACVNFTDPDVLALIHSRVPTVTLDFASTQKGSVLSDNESGMRALVEHVYELGHRRLALIHGEMTAVTQCRLTSFFDTCKRLGISMPRDYIRSAYYHDMNTTAEATRALLELPERPTCILFQDDYACLGGLQVLEQAGLSVPDDISVTGYDGVPLSRMLRPQLTTIRQNTERIGLEAARMLHEAIETPDSFVPHSISVSCELQPGHTVKRL